MPTTTTRTETAASRALDANEATTSELVQAQLPDSYVVKVFNNIFASQIPTDGGPEGAPGRRALPIAGNDADAKKTVTALLDDFGYDAVDLGPLSESWRVERDTPAYGKSTTADELREFDGEHGENSTGLAGEGSEPRTLDPPWPRTSPLSP